MNSREILEDIANTERELSKLNLQAVSAFNEEAELKDKYNNASNYAELLQDKIIDCRNRIRVLKEVLQP